MIIHKIYTYRCFYAYGINMQMISLTPPIRLTAVLGYDGRINDIIFCPPILKPDKHSTVVYFGGDIQDFPEIMKLHIDNKNHIKWNLENIAALLNASFPYSHIVIVKPSKMEHKTFSCYKNFVPSGSAGVPEHTPTHHALQHLEKLLQNVSQRIKSMTIEEISDYITTSLTNQQFYMDADFLQESIDLLNSKLELEDMIIASQHDLFNIELENFKKRIKTPVSNISDKQMKHDSIFDDEMKTLPLKNEVSSSNIIDNTSKEGVIKGIDSVNSQQNVSSTSQLLKMIGVHSPSYSKILKDKILDNSTSNNFWWQEAVSLDKEDLILMGFSKGCVVLNQLIYEFHYLKTLTPNDVPMHDFVSRITDMFWLDGGHSGGKNTWITSRSLLETLARLGIKIWVHVTPYQVRDDRRTWIRREEHVFTELLQKLDANVTRNLHFENATPDIHMHFNILKVFKNSEDFIDSFIAK